MELGLDLLCDLLQDENEFFLYCISRLDDFCKAVMNGGHNDVSTVKMKMQDARCAELISPINRLVI